jgi:type VI secretion system FHA domain protein
MPIEPEPSVAPDHIEQFVDEDVIETGMQLLDESEITGDDEFQSVLFGKEPKKVEPKVEPKPKMEMISANDDSADESVDVTADDLFDSFLDGLGISRAELHSSDNRPEMMMSAGLVLREFVEGTITLLAGRANLKNAFCLDQTTVLPRQNNPMKFSDNTDDLIKQLLVGDEGEYLEARDAVREANRDLINHQNAFLDAMNSAFIEFADRFDPDELQDRFDRTLNNKLFSFLNKSMYWNLYKDLYPIMTERGGGRFPQMFGEEFVKAYERQVAEYQRHDHEGTARPGLHDEPVDQATGPGLLATQKLDAPVIAESVGGDLAFEERDVVEPVSSDELHDSLIDDLENTLAGEIRRDQMGG